jgi:hypothetical protein
VQDVRNCITPQPGSCEATERPPNTHLVTDPVRARPKRLSSRRASAALAPGQLVSRVEFGAIRPLFDIVFDAVGKSCSEPANGY